MRSISRRPKGPGASRRLAALALALAAGGALAFSGALAALAALAPAARAHGGEDHGAPAPARQESAAPNRVRMTLDTQFLIGLRTRRAERGTLASAAGRVGTVVARPEGEMRLFAPFSGRLDPPPTGLLRLGDEVKKGQALGTLVPVLGGAERADVGLARTDAASRVRAAEARVALAEKQASRMKSLEGVVADKEIQAALAELEVARAELEKARADVGVLSGAVGSQRLVSTLAGTVVSAPARPGQQVPEGGEIVHVVDLSRLWVDVRLPEADAAGRIGEEAELALVTDPTSRFRAKKVAVSSLVDPATRTVQVIYEVENPDRVLRVGSLVDVAVRRGAPAPAVVVPEAAVLEREGRPVVVVKTGAEAFEVRPVALGAKAAGQAGIDSGLEPGERVVTEGASSVLLAAGR